MVVADVKLVVLSFVFVNVVLVSSIKVEVVDEVDPAVDEELDVEEVTATEVVVDEVVPPVDMEDIELSAPVVVVDEVKGLKLVVAVSSVDVDVYDVVTAALVKLVFVEPNTSRLKLLLSVKVMKVGAGVGELLPERQSAKKFALAADLSPSGLN